MSRATCALAAAALLAIAPAASAKDGAQAHLLAPLPVHARPGTLVTIRWTVTVLAADGRRVPFAAGGMFATLVGRDGASTTATARQTDAPLRVRIRVPAGGIRAIRLGLRGFALDATGFRPAPVYFPLG